jgi:hypothetical protein
MKLCHLQLFDSEAKLNKSAFEMAIQGTRAQDMGNLHELIGVYIFLRSVPPCCSLQYLLALNSKVLKSRRTKAFSVE